MEGAKTYEGPPCNKVPSHTERYASTGACVSCTRKRGRRNRRLMSERAEPKQRGDFTDPLSAHETGALLACGTFAMRSIWRDYVGLPPIGHYMAEIHALQAVEGEGPPECSTEREDKEGFSYLEGRSLAEVSRVLTTTT